MPGKRKIALAAAALLVVAAAAYLLLRPAQEGDGLTLYGNVEIRQVELSFTVEGRLADSLVEEGDRVTKGQSLAHIERGYFEDALAIANARVAAQEQVVAKMERGSRPEEIDQARAQEDSAKADVVNARLQFERQQELVARKASPQRALDDARAALDMAQGHYEAAQATRVLAELGPRTEDVSAAKAQLDSEKALRGLATRRLEDTVLAAPADGVIMTRVREPGAVLSPGTTVFTMAKDRPVWVRAFVPEPELGRVQPGRPARVFTDARPGKPYSGHIGYVSPTAEFTPKTVQTPDLRTDLVFRFHVVIDDADALLRQGMPATVVVE